MITPSEELAEAIGFSYKSLKHGTDSGSFSPRMAVALENHLGLERGILKRTSEIHAPRMKRVHREAFRSLIQLYAKNSDIDKVSRLMECHYEVARHIVSGFSLPNLLNIRALIRNTGDQRFVMFDDPSYVLQEYDNTLGRLIRDRRIDLGFTQKQLAEKLGCSVTLFCRYERKQRGLGDERLLQLAEILNDPQITRIAHDRLQCRETADDRREESHANAA